MSDPATIDSPPLRSIIIPTPSIPQTRQKDSETDNSLKHYFANYQRLKKENTILNNQLEIINKEKEELQEKLEAMKVLFLKLRGNMNKKKSAIVEQPLKLNVNIHAH
jgi:peptidoglycan hydrolase CwlO-like protein